MQPNITIFTPTFNRGYLLSRLYNSLLLQKDKNFEWLIIDDGSTDNTVEIVEAFTKDNIINIRYILQKNKGKHAAMNHAFREAAGKYFVCIDSDDYLVVDAIENINLLVSRIDKNEDLAGVVGMAQTTDGQILGKAPRKDIVSNTMEIRDHYHVQGEPEIYKTNYLRNIEFPIFEDEKFLTEAYVFDLLTIRHPLLYTNIPLIVKEFQDDGLTRKEPMLRINNPIGTLHYYRQRMSISKDMIGKCKASINLKRFSYHTACKVEFNFTMYEKTLLTILSPLAYGKYILDKRTIKKER